jgi:signal transduction histidine kinase
MDIYVILLNLQLLSPTCCPTPSNLVFEGENVYISLSLLKEADGEFIEITVQDNGVGIPKDELNRIFERFYQVQRSQSVARIGSGVGLALVKELVHLMHGEVYALSTLGKGIAIQSPAAVFHNAPMTEPTLHPDGRITMPKVCQYLKN